MVKIKFECIIELDDNDGIKPAKVIKWRTTQNDDLS